MSLFKTKVKFVSNYNDDSQYREVVLEFLFAALTYCDAEKATIARVKQEYYPKEDGEINVIGIAPYSILPDMKEPDSDLELKWFEIHVELKELKEDGGIKYVIYKYLKQAEDVSHAEKLISSELRHDGELFDNFKVKKVIQMKFVEVIA